MADKRAMQSHKDRSPVAFYHCAIFSGSYERVRRTAPCHIGDIFHGDRDATLARAEELRAAGSSAINLSQETIKAWKRGASRGA